VYIKFTPQALIIQFYEDV